MDEGSHSPCCMVMASWLSVVHVAISPVNMHICPHSSDTQVQVRKCLMQELLAQATHYSERQRKAALQGLDNVFSHHPLELHRHVWLGCMLWTCLVWL